MAKIQQIKKLDQEQVSRTQPPQSKRTITKQDVLRLAAEEEAKVQQLNPTVQTQTLRQQQLLQDEIETFNLLKEAITDDISTLELNYQSIEDLLDIINNFSPFYINTTNEQEDSLIDIVSNVNSKSQDIKENLNLLDESINRILSIINQYEFKN